MRKYECTTCKREVVAPHDKDEVDMLCCQQDKPVKFKAVTAKVIVPVTTLPPDMGNKPPVNSIKLPANPLVPIKK